MKKIIEHDNGYCVISRPCGDYFWCDNTCSNYKPKEKSMKDKIQLTEEQAIEILEQATIVRVKGSMKTWINNLKFAGYIRKSELKTIVDEAEEMYSKWLHRKDQTMSESIVMSNMDDAIQALKKDHPEYKI